jgi:hypothetical protein
MGVQQPLYQDSSINMWQLEGTILLGTNFFKIYVLNSLFLSLIILYISLHIIAWKLENLNKSTVFLTSTYSINRTTEKKVAKITLKIRVQNVHSTIKVGIFFFCSIIHGLKKFPCLYQCTLCDIQCKEKYTGKIILIILCIFIHSSFCVLNFVLLACRPYFVKFSWIMTRLGLD